MIGKLLRGVFGKKPAEVVDRRVEIESLALALTTAAVPDRVKAIAALAQLDHQAANHHADVLRVLVEFVRRERSKSATRRGEPGPDVRAALGAIGRRPWAETETEPLVLAGLDLGDATISGADLRKADLSNSIVSNCNFLGSKLLGANLAGAVLDDSLVMGIRLEGVNLTGASLRAANLTDSILDGASLAGADLSYTVFVKASLKRVDLTGATVLGTQFGGCDLSGVRGLTRAQLAGAETDNLTELPADLG